MSKLLFEIGLKAIITDNDGKILLLKRSKPYVSDIQKGFPEKLRWDLPGGRLEPSESIVEGLRREIKEETNLDFEDFDQIIDIHEAFFHEGYHTVRIYFQVKGTGKIKLSSEHIEAKYFDKNAIVKLIEEDILELSTKKILLKLFDL